METGQTRQKSGALSLILPFFTRVSIPPRANIRKTFPNVFLKDFPFFVIINRHYPSTIRFSAPGEGRAGETAAAPDLESFRGADTASPFDMPRIRAVFLFWILQGEAAACACPYENIIAGQAAMAQPRVYEGIAGFLNGRRPQIMFSEQTGVPIQFSDRIRRRRNPPLEKENRPFHHIPPLYAVSCAVGRRAHGHRLRIQFLYPV